MSPQSPDQITVVTIDDHQMFREQLAHLIEKSGEMRVVGQADNVADGFTLIDQLRPNIAIVDITLRGSSGLELLKELRAKAIDVPVLVLSMHDESLYAERALHAGAKGYVTKHEASVDVMNAIRKVVRGEIYLNPRFMAQLASKMMTRGADSARGGRPVDRLTDRELEVFELIGHGLTNREIGAQLGLELGTVDSYAARIKEKLKIENASRLRVEASRWVQQRHE